MATRNFEIQLTVDPACYSPLIEWENPLCGAVTCVLQNGKFLKVEMPEGCLECFYVTITCQDPCSDCETQRLRVCPCTSDVDCGDCEHCASNGICVSNCPNGQFCYESECRSCDFEHPCPCNQVCVDGNCECPVDAPYKNSKGCCSECALDSHCPPCFVCTRDGCVPKECPTGMCDPSTSACVECYNSGQCPAGKCCVNNHCVCCEGSYLDPSSGDCSPNPLCQRDSDCSKCSICNAGTCIPVSCPPGYIRVVGDPCCKPECDCNNPNCPKGANCLLEPSSGDCYCEGCGSACDSNIDCPAGCYCDNGVCTPNPCYSECTTGADCGPGCGCDQGVCVPCNSFVCADCNGISGCTCISNSCVKGCSGPCYGADDCARGCGCFDGECKPCSTFNCLDCLNVFGCECINGKCKESPCSDPTCKCVACNGIEDCGVGCYCLGGTCRPNPCDSPCAGDDNCGIGCHCVGGRCVPCDGPCGNDGNPTNDPPCSDTLKITKIDDGCDLEGKLLNSKCCQCPDMTIGFDFTALADDGQNAVMLVNPYLSQGKGTTWPDFLTLPTLNSLNILNAYPLSGSFELKVTTYITAADANCHPLAGSGTATEVSSYTFNYAGTWNLSHTFSYPKPGNCIFANTLTGYGVVTKVVYEVLPITEFVFPNDCKYKIDKKIIKTLTKSLPANDTDVPYVATPESSCRKPLFSWYKSSARNLLFNTGNIFRKIYADKVSGFYTDKLFDTFDGLEYGKYYGLKSDCACTGNAVYDCNGDGAADRLTFNHPKNFTFHIDPCGTDVIFDEVLVNCDVMTQSTIKPSYEVHINGITVATITLPGSGILIPAGTTYSLSPKVPVTTVAIKLLNADCPWFIMKNVTPSDYRLNTLIGAPPCTGGDITIATDIINGSGPYSWELFQDGVSIDTGTFSTPPVSLTTPKADGTYVLAVTDANSCYATKQFVYNDASNILENYVTITNECAGGSGILVITNNYTEAIDLVIDGNPAVTLSSAATGNYSVSSGLIDVTASLTSDPACTFINPVTVNVSCCADPIVGISQACDPYGSKTITVTNNGAQNILVYVYRASDNTLVGSCAGVAPAGTCIKTGLPSTDAHIIKVRGEGEACANISYPIPAITCGGCAGWTDNVILNYTCAGSTISWDIMNANVSGDAVVTGAYSGTIAAGGSQSGSTTGTATFIIVRSDDNSCTVTKTANCSVGCSAITDISIYSDCSNLLDPQFVVDNPNNDSIAIYKDNVLYANTSAGTTTGSFAPGFSTLIKVALQSDSTCYKQATVSCAAPPPSNGLSYDCTTGLDISGGYTGLITIDNGPTNYNYPSSPIFLQDGVHTVKMVGTGETESIVVSCCAHSVTLSAVCDLGATGDKGVITAYLSGLNVGDSYTINLYDSLSNLISSTGFVASNVIESQVLPNVPDGTYYAAVTNDTYNAKSYVGNPTLSPCRKTSAPVVVDCEILGTCALSVGQSDFAAIECGNPGSQFCYTYTNNTGYNVTFKAFKLPSGGGSCFNQSNPNWSLILTQPLAPGATVTVNVAAPASCSKFVIEKDPSCTKSGWLTIDSISLSITAFNLYN